MRRADRQPAGERADRQPAHREPPVLAVVGENVVDLVPAGPDGTYRALPGGSPANTAIAATRLGVRAALVARIGADAFGRRVRARLTEAGVDPAYLVDAAEPSSLAAVDLDAAGRARYDFWLTGTADACWRPGELPDPLAESVRALHTGSLALHLEPGAAAVAEMVRREHARGRVVVGLDPNVRPGATGDPRATRERLDALVPYTHVVKASDEDLAFWFPGRDPGAAARELLDRGPDLVVVTLGPRGAVGLTRRHEVAVGAPFVEVADTVGAGDAFMGALYRTLVRIRPADLGEADLRAALVLAARAGAYTCTRPGADPPTAAELAAWTG